MIYQPSDAQCDKCAKDPHICAERYHFEGCAAVEIRPEIETVIVECPHFEKACKGCKGCKCD